MSDTPFRLLLVADNPANLVSLEAILDLPDYRLDKTGSGEEALRHLLTHQADVILLDVQMPGIDGFETARLIRSRASSHLTPIVFLTAEITSNDVVAKDFALGAMDYLAKPLVPEILRAKIRAFAEAKWAADALRQSEASFREALESLVDGIVIVNDSGEIVYTNPSAAFLLGKAREQLQGGPFGLPLVGEQSAQLDVVTSRGERAVVELRTDHTVWRGAPAWLASLRDVTEASGAEEAARETQRLRLRDRFLSRVSHELRTPTAVIYQFATILLDGLAGELSADQREYVQIIFRNVDELALMIDDLMDATRADASERPMHPETVDIVPIIRHAQRRMTNAANAKQVDVVLIGPDTLPACADSSYVRRIMLNLITHAVQQTPAGTAVRVRWGVDQEAPACLRVSVTDEAELLTEADRLHLFDMMHQTGEAIDDGRKGLGLGLNVAKGLVESQGGRLWVESQPPRGCVYAFTLPLAAIGTPTKQRETP